jgi:hypothetical protein
MGSDRIYKCFTVPWRRRWPFAIKYDQRESGVLDSYRVKAIEKHRQLRRLCPARIVADTQTPGIVGVDLYVRFKRVSPVLQAVHGIRQGVRVVPDYIEWTP